MKAVLALVLLAATVVGQDVPLDARQLAERSLPLRTALHHDPTLEAPLTALIQLYRTNNQVDALTAMYRAHLQQYPRDVSARIVLLRVSMQLADPEAPRTVLAAAATFPNEPYLRYLAYQVREAQRQPQAIDELDRAIELETLPPRRQQWIEQLLPEAAVQQRDDLLDKHLAGLAELIGDTPEGAVEAARKMLSFDRAESALRLLDAAAQQSPAPELMVQIELEAAAALRQLDRRQDAAARLDELLSRLAADYWRRGEVLRRRIALVERDQERHAMIDAARQRLASRPQDEAAVLELAELLGAFERRREALEVLVDAATRLPQSARIERATLDLLDLLRDEAARQTFLARRLETQPQRDDLRYLLARSLYLLDRPDEAQHQLDQALARLDAAAQATRRLETARFLRRRLLHEPAGALLRRVLEHDPIRLDVKRELAEVYLTEGRQHDALALFDEPPAQDAAIEHLLDLVSFLIERRMHRPARDALVQRIAREPANLELRTLLLKVYEQMGLVAAGRDLIDETRPLADTAARYRQWLEAAAAFHEAFDGAGAFFETEGDRLAAEREPWRAHTLERRLAFAEAAGRHREAARVIELLEGDLAGAAPAEARLPLRRKRLELISADPSRAGAVEGLLRELAAEHPDQATDANAQLAALYARTERHDLLQPLLPQLDPDAVSDLKALAQLEPLYAQQNELDKVLGIQRRLIDAEPGHRGLWERHLTWLAAMGDETRLRLAIRRALAERDAMPLNEDTQVQLQQALLDSHFRAAGRAIGLDDEAAWADVLVELDSADRLITRDAQAMWIAWLRAHVLNRQQRQAERDEAIAELRRLAEACAAADSQAIASLMIGFPDGLGVRFEHAINLLRADDARTVRPAPASPRFVRDGDALDVRWVFDLGPMEMVTWLHTLPDGDILVAGMSGDLHRLEGASGKLRWTRRGALPAVSPAVLQLRLPQPGGGWRHHQHMDKAPTPVVDENGRIFVAVDALIRCLDDQGQLRWEVVLGEPASDVAAGLPPAPLQLFLYEADLVAFQPMAMSLWRLDPDSGKLRSYRSLDSSVETEAAAAAAAAGAAMPLMVTWLNSGISVDGHRALLYGRSAAILDLAGGEPLWTFEPRDGGAFPIKLEAPSDASSADVPPPAVAVSSPLGPVFATTRGGLVTMAQPSPYLYSGTSFRAHAAPMPAYISYNAMHVMRPTMWSNPAMLTSGPPMAAVSPAVAWAAAITEAQNPRMGLLVADQLVLISPQGSMALRLDLPLAATELQAYGTFIGAVGRKLVFLQQQALSVIDLATGQRDELRLAMLTEGLPPYTMARFTAMIDGPFVYVTGPGGVVGFNLATLRQVMHSPWPEGVGPEAPAANEPRQQVQYLHQGLSLHQQGQSGWGPCLPLVDQAVDGMLLVTPTPSRVAALVATEGRQHGD